LQVHHPTNKAQKLLLVSIILVGFLLIFATFLGKEAAKVVTDITYIPVTGMVVALSALLALRFKQYGNHGKAWLCFLGGAVTWFIGETIWTVYELVFNVNPFPSLADVFFIAGYPLFLFFLIYYLKPVRKAASRKITVGAITMAVVIMIPSVYMAYNFDPKVSLLENALATSYPIADSIILVPALIGVVLFFRGEVNFTWSLICLAIVLQSAADSLFQYATFTNTYYSGHPADIIFLWSYILFSFGVYDHIQIFKKTRGAGTAKRQFEKLGP
jgi:hypothetical protein